MRYDDEPPIWRVMFSLPIVLFCSLPTIFAVGLSLPIVFTVVCACFSVLACVLHWNEGAF